MGPANRAAIRAEMETLRNETEAKLATILSPEQMQEFQKLREDQRMRMTDRKHHRGRDPLKEQ